MTRFSFIIFLSAFSLFHVSSSGQDVSGRTFRILLAVGQASDLHYDSGAGSESTRLDIYGKPSVPYPLPSSADMELFRLVPSSESPAEMVREVVVSFSVPKDSERILLVLMPQPENRYAIKALSDDIDLSSPEVLRLINLASMPVAFRVNDSQQIVNPGETMFIDVPTRAALVQQAVQKSQGWIPVLQTEKRFNRGFRYTYLVFDYMENPDGYNNPVPPPVISRTFVERIPKVTL